MVNLGPALVALLVASMVTATELITSDYSGTFFTVRRSLSLYAYSLIYGALALIIVIVGIGFFQIQVVGISNPWVQAMIIGLGIKAVLHIRLFSVTKNREADPLPIGSETIVQIFEPHLKRMIGQDETDGLHKFLDPRVSRYPDPNDIKARIIRNLDRHITKADRTAFLQDLEDKLSDPNGGIYDAMVLYLAFMGKKNLERVFPLNVI